MVMIPQTDEQAVQRVIADRFTDIYVCNLDCLFDSLEEVFEDSTFRRPPLLATTSEIGALAK